MITLNAATISRAWLAVATAAPEDLRTVHVEEFTDRGVRLIATDGFWLAMCWVPAWDADPVTDTVDPDGWEPEPEPGLDELPDRVATLSDDEWRVRDLMKHLAKITRKPEEQVLVQVRFDLSVSLYDDDEPTLSPELAPVRCSIEIPNQERVLVLTIEGPYVNWRAVVVQFTDDRRTVGHDTTEFSSWMLSRIARVPSLVGGVRMGFVWLDGQRGRWQVPACRLAFPPHGVFRVATPHDAAPQETDPDDDPDDAAGMGAAVLELFAGRTITFDTLTVTLPKGSDS